MLCREILYEDPFQFKKGSPDRGEVWSKIARALNSCKAEIRQGEFTLLQIKYKETNGKDEASSGTSRQVSELDQLLEDIIEKEKDGEESRNVVSPQKDDQGREKAENMRKTAMERVGQTKKRQEEGEDTVSTKRRRRSGNQTIGYVREKSGTERKVREQEIELKKAQVALQQQQATQSQAQMQEIMMVIQQQKQQSQNMTALLVQQHQQYMSSMQSFLKKPQQL